MLGRNGLGSPLFAATGNGHGRPVAYPASDHPIAVGASTDQATIASYSNVGFQTSVVAPSSGGTEGVYTTDVSLPTRGFSSLSAPPATTPARSAAHHRQPRSPPGSEHSCSPSIRSCDARR